MTSRRLKILQVLSPTSAGGLERVVEALAIGHHRRGHKVTVAALLLRTEEAHPFVKALITHGVDVHEIRTGNRAYLHERRAVAHLCRTIRPSVVHTHGYRRDLLHRRVASELGIPTVTTVHGPSKMGGVKGAFFEWLQRLNYQRFDAVVAVSESLYNATLADGVRSERLHLIPNAWGDFVEPFTRRVARQALGLDDCDRVVGWVGRLIPVKGADIFLRALAQLEEPRPVGAIIGYGPEEDHIRQQVKKLSLDCTVRLHTNIRDAGRYFRAFDAYALSSRSEGLPIVLLEAMAAGTPIVATNVGGVTDAVGERGGLLVPPENPRALAAAISCCLNDRESAAQRAAWATRRLRNDFALSTFLDRYEHVYQSVARPQ